MDNNLVDSNSSKNNDMANQNPSMNNNIINQNQTINNDTINQNNNSPKKSQKWIIIILIIVILSLVGFGIYFLMQKDNKTENNNSNSNSSSNDNTQEETYDLVLPERAFMFNYLLQDFSINDKDARYWMMNEAFALYYDDYDEVELDSFMCDVDENDRLIKTNSEGETDCLQIPASKIKEYFLKIFGPDTEYKDEDVGDDMCFSLGSYDEKEKIYYVATACGFLNFDFMEAREYDRKINGDYIYVYNYAVITSYDGEEGYYIYKDYASFKKDIDITPKNYKYHIENDDEEETKLNKKFDEMIKNKEVATYKYTFKKQSDGKYYFESATVEK